jgi:hypothetical protein
MKKAVFLLVILLWISPCFAKRKPKFAFDHTGTITYHIPPRRYALEGRTDLYESGDYVCAGGDEHHAPDCRKISEWFFRDPVSIDISLEDSTKISIKALEECPFDIGSRYVNLCSIIAGLEAITGSNADPILHYDGDVAEFRYGFVNGAVVYDPHLPKLISSNATASK